MVARDSRNSAASRIRFAGFVAIVFVAAFGFSSRPEPPLLAAAVQAGSACIVGLLWLTLSGFFGYGSANRDDWVGLIPFGVALFVREVLTVHSVQEIEIQFAQGPVGRHSVVYPLLQLFFTPMVHDLHAFVMHLNSLLASVACGSLYLFVRQRLGNRGVAFLCALFFATHPLLARFAPTDAPYSLLLASWFCGLALLSSPRIDPWALLGGLSLLGVAATTRMEGAVYLLASLVLLRWRPILEASRRHRGFTTAAFVIVYGQLAAQMWILLPNYFADVRHAPTELPPFPLDWIRGQLLTEKPYFSHSLALLTWAGALAGILPRLRLGLTGFLAMLIVLLPIAGSWQYGSALHKMMPTYAMQAMAAGVGSYALIAWIPVPARLHWLVVLPGTMMAFAILFLHRTELTRPYLYSDEYDLVRAHLSPGGTPLSNCTLLTLNANFVADVDIHDFRQVVPGVRVVDCRTTDCLAEVARGGCFYYVRSAAAFYHVTGVPIECEATGIASNGSPFPCLNDASRHFEESVELELVESRTIDIFGSFQDRGGYSPRWAPAGLFRVRGRDHPVARDIASAPSTVERPRVPVTPQEEVPRAPASVAMPNSGEPVIPAGNEQLLLAMLGGSETLTDGCKLSGATAEPISVKATYACGGRPVSVELTHPNKVATGGRLTNRFAIIGLGEGVPTTLLDEIEKLVRAREASFEWKIVASERRSPALVPLALVGLVELGVLMLICWAGPGKT